jgi:hypothetical protein
VDLAFQIYDLEGNPVGDPIFLPNTPATDGIVNTVIPIIETVFDGTGRQLGVSVNGTPEMTPRIPLASAPQAFRVNCAGGDEVVESLSLGGSTAGGSLKVFAPGAGERRAEAGAEMSARICGRTALRTESGQTTVELTACDPFAGYDGGRLHLSQLDGTSGATLFAGLYGTATLRNQTGDWTLGMQGGEAGGRDGAEINMRDGTTTTVVLDADDNLGAGGGALYLNNSDGENTVEIDADESDGAAMHLYNSEEEETITVDADWYNGARVFLNNSESDTTIEIAADDDGHNASMIVLRQRNTLPGGGLFPAIELDASEYVDDYGWWGGRIRLYNRWGDPQILLRGDGGRHQRAEITVYDPEGSPCIRLQGKGDNDKGRVVTQELEITGGGDLSEQFDVAGAEGTVQPGVLVSIDPQNPGKLLISDTAYDRRVAGVISGAGDVDPGVLMGHSGSVADGQYPVALTGRVYCWADASNGPIEPGDLLTTSNVPGHAMKVSDYAKAQGAIIGKAMTSLDRERGLVLVLVTLQ